MATLEKPKQKKKKKVKPLNVRVETPTDVFAWSNADIEFPSTSTSDDIEIIPQQDVLLTEQLAGLTFIDTENATKNDTPVAQIESDNKEQSESEATAKIDNNNQPIDTKSLDNQSDENTNKISVDSIIAVDSSENATQIDECIIPSAPEIEDMEEPNSKQIQYPSLLEMANIEPKTISGLQQSEKQRIILKPFTASQLNELYFNPEIKSAESFEMEFISAELSGSYIAHPLYDLIKKYSQSRYNLKINRMDLQGYIVAFQQNSQEVWTIENRIKTYDGTCQDMERIRKYENYEHAILNEKEFQKVSSSLNNISQLVCYNFMTNLYACESYKTQITQNINELLSDSAFSNVKNEQNYLNKKIEQNKMQPMREIRINISILFSFLRRHSPDKQFSKDIIWWLQKLSSVYIRLATYQDHLFLIYHVLRCPAGIASWAPTIIQMPKRPLDNTVPFQSIEVNHYVTFLKVLLMPAKQRNEFLSQMNPPNTPVDASNDDLWIVIDSDGEEDHTPTGESAGLKENDLIALFNQIPFENLFCCMTFIKLDGDQPKLDDTQITGHHLLKFIAFSTQLVELIGDGLRTYANERFKQFAKLLCRLVRHCVQYVSDMHTIFKTNNSLKDDQLCSRIQIELDTFVLRSSNYIYLSRCLGAWQYLATLPFSELHITTIWKMYYLLTVGFTKDVIENVTNDFKAKASETNFLERFNDIVIDVPAEDLYYLLQTFASMAMSREIIDFDFIYCITIDLFKIGFINVITKDTCYKIVRDLLVNITTKHTDLISSLLFMLKDNFRSVDKYGTYLFKSLPLDQWKPSLEIFEIAAAWLSNFSFDTPESAMARTIFSRLNWNFDKHTGELFLSHDIQIRMACLIVDVSSKHVPETIGMSGISESVRQVSNLVKGQSPHQQFITWCWNMVSVLRLHSFDQNTDFVRRTIRNPVDALRLVSEIERLPSIAQGVTDKRPIAVYLSILVTMWGHSVPQICHKGFAQMQQLLNDYRHSTVIRCIQLVTPFFFECPESLSKCTAFQTILNAILAADRTYIRMAKDFIASDYPGPVVELFANMIQSQIIDYCNYGLQTPTVLINLWLNCLTANPNWYKDSNAIHIVDLILRIAYQFPDSWATTKNFFKQLCKTTNESKPGISTTFLPFLGGSQPTGFIATPTANAPWFALLTLEIEHEVFELDTKLWPAIIHQLHTAPAKFSMDNVIKSAAKLVGCPACPSHSLVIYKLVNLILNCSYDQHVLPILCQKFFHLYLTRITFTADEIRFNDVHGVADKFYDHNIPLMKKLKGFLIEAVKYDKDESLKLEDEILSQFHVSRSRLYHSFELWLEETRLNKILNLRSEDYPPPYDLNRLSLIFANNNTHWTEFIQLSIIRQSQRDEANAWLRSCFRYVAPEKHSTTIKRTAKSNDPKESIIRQSQSYDAPVPPWKIELFDTLLLQKFSYDELEKAVLIKMDKDFKKLIQLSKKFNMDVQELSSLDSNYREMLRLLHENKFRTERKEIRCSSIVSRNSCKGAQYITVQMPYHEINEVISNKIKLNRDRHELIINKLIEIPSQAQILPIVQIQYSIKCLLDMYHECKRKNDEQKSIKIAKYAIIFFYGIIKNIDENISSFHPAQDLCTVAMSQLGIFLKDCQNTEGAHILKKALLRPDLIQPLSDVFVPSTTVPKVFLELYQSIVESHFNNKDPKILFVLLSKFDINSWLTSQKPKLVEINGLIKLIARGLECWNKNESDLIQGVLRRHLIHIFLHDFPEHYGDVLIIMLKGCSENKIFPSVLLDLLNTLYKRSNCPELYSVRSSVRQTEEIIYFATNQRILSYRELHETVTLLATHFQHERLQHGLHGLYPIHKDYCEKIAIMLETFGYADIVAAVYANPGALSDTLVDFLWPSICDMFAPWLFPYYTQNMPNLPANWIRQFNTPILLPWSELYISDADQLLTSFISCIQFLIDTFPACDQIMRNLFYWYETYYGNVAVSRHVLKPTNRELIKLPWIRFKPTPLHINGFGRLLQQYLPDCHAFLGHIFMQVSWTPWLQYNLSLWDYSTRTQVLSTLLLMFVKFSYEPEVRENAQLLAMLQEATLYPWYLLDYQGIENIFEWYVTSTEPSAILCLNSEHSAVDNSVLNLLQISSGMLHTNTEQNQSLSQLQAKRILYVKSIVRMLKLCGSKYQQLLQTADGVKSFHASANNLLILIDSVVTKENEIDGVSMMIEIVGRLQSQSEFTSRILVKAIIIWQSTCNIGNILLNTTLNAIGSCKVFSLSILMLLEATTYNYFKHLESTKEYHSPSWPNVIQRLGAVLPPFELNRLIENNFLLCLHIYIVYKLNGLQNSGDKITFLQNIYKLLENYKTDQNTEQKVAAIWGLLISCGYKLLETNKNAKEPLLTLARYLLSISNTSDGWGEGLLGAIGFKKETISNKQRIMTRCLACIIFTLFPDSEIQCKDYENGIEELKNMIKTKKYTDLRTVASLAIDIIEIQSKNLENTKENVCAIIRLFYTDCFLTTLEDIWKF